MVLSLLLAVVSFAVEPAPSEVLVDAKVPTEVLVDGVKLAQLYVPGRAAFTLPAGSHQLRIYTNGNHSDFPLQLLADATTHVVVGRAGVSIDAPQVAAAADGDPALPVPVEFRALVGPAQIRLDGGSRLQLTAGGRLQVELSQGDHPLSVRNAAGTVIWADGVLAVGRGDRVVVHVTEGRLPEISGVATFRADGG